MEWTLGFVLAEVDFSAYTSKESIHSRDPAAPAVADGASNHHDNDALDMQKDLQKLLRYAALANAFVQQMESSVQELVLRCRSMHAQYADVVKQFIWW